MELCTLLVPQKDRIKWQNKKTVEYNKTRRRRKKDEKKFFAKRFNSFNEIPFPPATVDAGMQTIITSHYVLIQFHSTLDYLPRTLSR